MRMYRLDWLNTLRRGESHPKAVLTDHEVELVRRLRSDGMSFGNIAAKFDIGKSTVRDMCAYRTR
jgi:transposase